MENWGGKPTNFQEEGSGLFSPFISAVLGWPAALSFCGRWSDSWFGYWGCGVDGLRDCSWLIKIIFVERVDELSEVLDC